MEFMLNSASCVAREMLEMTHAISKCYQHNIRFRGNTTPFLLIFRRLIVVIQVGAADAQNALQEGRK
ncbi:hypothetical protein [Pseudomonas sp. DSP3-2-2]|uniref:hypothetical protein n=1 Tax=unclassified Pseudomonas TaxID=196821 RepID=UPI003CF550C7